MGGQPHDSSGRECSACGKKFRSIDLTLRIRKKVGKILEHRIVCRDCWNKHYLEGE